MVDTRWARALTPRRRSPVHRVGQDPGAGGRSRPGSGTRIADRSSAREPWLTAAVFLLSAVLAWERMGSAARNTIWAEDGVVFLGDALRTGPDLLGLFSPYAGYLHVVPRLIAQSVATVLPVDQAALGLAGGCAVVVGLLAATVYRCSRAVVEPVWGRLCIAAITVLVPVATSEVLGSVANLHWYFLWTAPWVLLHRPATRGGAAALALITCLGALTEIQMAVFLPLLLLHLRDRRTWPVKVAMVVGLAAQVVASVLAPRGEFTAAGPDVASVVHGYELNAAMSVWVRADTAGRYLVEFGWWVGILALVPFLVAVAAVVVRGTPTQRMTVVVLLSGSVVLWAAAFVLNPNPAFYYSTFTSEQLALVGYLRYAVVPSMFLLAVLVLAVVALAAGRSRPARFALGSALTVGLALVLLPRFSDPGLRSGGPFWDQEVATVDQACATAPASEQPVLLAPPGWVVGVRCADLVG